jgi:hypothetical protein
LFRVDFSERSQWIFELVENVAIAAEFKSYLGAWRYERVTGIGVTDRDFSVC